MNVAKSLKTYFHDWSKIDWAWTILSTIAVTVAGILMWDKGRVFLSVISLVGTIAGMWNVILIAKCKIVSNFIVGTLNCICFGIYYLMYNLLGNAGLNLLFFLPLGFVMLFVWLRHKTKPDSVPTRLLTWKGYFIFGVILVVATVGFGYALSSVSPDTPVIGDFISGINPSPYLDAFTTVANMVAMILLILLFIEQWWLWLVVDMSTLIMWIIVSAQNASSWAMVVLYSCWLINAAYGTWQWYKNRDQKHFSKMAKEKKADV